MNAVEDIFSKKRFVKISNGMKIFIATTNKAKIARVKKLTSHLDVEWITPIDLGIDSIDVEEGSDLEQNAQQKAFAYRAVTDLPIIATDIGFHIEGESLDPAKPKRNALGNLDEKMITQEEMAKAFHEFYLSLAKRRGGNVPAWWEDVYALSLPNGETYVAHARRNVVLTDEIHGPIDIYAPLRCMYIVEATGKYVVDQTEDDVMCEMRPVQAALEKLIQKID